MKILKYRNRKKKMAKKYIGAPGSTFNTNCIFTINGQKIKS